MSIWEAIFLGALQGLTEFLPVSSSGHLVLAQKIMGIGTSEAVMFDLAVHLGTLFAVVWAMFGTIKRMLKKGGGRAIFKIASACAPTAVIGIIFKGFFREAFSGRFLGWGFAATALILLFCDFFVLPKKSQSLPWTEPLENVSYPAAIMTGVFQGAAILPGLSRSGTTVCAALTMGASRHDAAELSFLMSIPTVLGAAVFEAVDLGTDAFSVGAGALIAGFLAALVFGYFAVRFMINIIKRCRLYGFAVYAAALAVICFIVL